MATEEQIKVDSPLVRLCIDSACASGESVESWRLQRRTLERLPAPLAEALLRCLLRRRLLYPSLLETFKFCAEEIDLRGENSVDAEWMAYIGAFPYLRSLNIADCHRISSHSLWPIAGMASLRCLDLSRCSKVTDAGIKHLLSIANLEKLHIAQTGVTVDGVMLLSSLKNLTILDLGGLPLSDVALHSLEGLSKLEHLELWGSNITDKGAVVFKSFPSLKSLNLGWTSVTALPNLKHLASLNMSHCNINSVHIVGSEKSPLNKLILQGASLQDTGDIFSSLDGSSLSFLDLSNTSLSFYGFLSCMSALEHLELSCSMLGDDSVEKIAEVGINLRYLNLSGTKISSVGIATLAGFVPNLRFLSVSQTVVDDSGIAYLCTMPQLQDVDLSNTKVQGFLPPVDQEEDEISSLLPLESLKHLERLNLSGTLLTEPALFPLSKFQELNHLTLKSTSLTDDCLPYLISLEKLVHLSINDALLTDGGLEFFYPQPTLRVLDLRGCWLLTEEALLVYHQNHPQIEVKHELVHAHSVIGTSSTASESAKQSGSPKSISKPSPSKDKRRKSLLSSMVFKKEILDQRIKYSKEQLLELQHSPLVPLRSQDVSFIIPEFDP